MRYAFPPYACCRSPTCVTPSRYTLRRPVVGGAVEFGDGRGVGGHDHPRLFVFGENMEPRGERVRIIQGASADEADFVAGMNQFARDVGILKGQGPYESVVAARFSDLWAA